MALTLAGGTAFPAAQDTILAREIGRIGSIDGQDAITRPGASRIGSDGSLFALFPIESVVRRISLEGTVLEIFGRRGAGPGEFQRPMDIDVFGDRLWVFEDDRVTTFDLETREVSTIRLAARLDAPREMLPRIAGVLPNGDFIIDREPEGLRRAKDDFPLRVSSPDGTLGDTVAIVHREHILIYENPRADVFGQMSIPTPFPLSDLWAVQRGIPGLVIVDVRTRRDQGLAVVRSVLADGSIFDSTTVRMTSVPEVSSRERNSVYDRHVDALLWSRGVDARGEREARDLASEKLGDLSHRNAAERVLAAADGTIWIEAPETNTSQEHPNALWAVLTPRLDLVAWVEVGAEFRLLDARNGIAWAVAFDELDVAYLVLLDVQGSG